MIFPIYHIKHKILTTVIAPHGITDLIHAAQNNNTKQLLSMNAFCVSTSFGLSQNDVTMLGLNAFFLVSTLVHFRHDYRNTLRPNRNELQQYSLSFITILSFIINRELFYWYMCFIHVPNHYYLNNKILQKNYAFNVTFILGFTLLLFFLGEQQIFFQTGLFPFYKGVVISHVIYQELYVHSSLSH